MHLFGKDVFSFEKNGGIIKYVITIIFLKIRIKFKSRITNATVVIKIMLTPIITSISNFLWLFLGTLFTSI